VRVIALACLTFSLSVTPALATPLPDGAPRSHNSRVANMRHIAVSLYGPDVCGDTLTVPIMRGPMLQHEWVAYAHREGDAPQPGGCYIVVKDMPWDTEELCRVLEHEYGHLSGYRAPEGQEYIRPDGTPDYQHSNDPRSLMWPFEIAFFAPCADGAADT
jgi:hypothetical protein